MLIKPLHNQSPYQALLDGLRADCGSCCALCCCALYFAKSEEFPWEKPAGEPCQNLKEDFRCAAHASLTRLGFRGCVSYDCQGAGQKVASGLYRNRSWRESPSLASEMFSVFLIVRQLSQILWYLLEGAALRPAAELRPAFDALILENEQLLALGAQALLALSTADYRARANSLLKQASDLVTAAIGAPLGKQRKGRDFLGKDFKGARLHGQNFSASLLIAANLSRCSLYGANFLGADMRDCNLKNADLSESIFLTQSQISAAVGNSGTKLPAALSRPGAWREN